MCLTVSSCYSLRLVYSFLWWCWWSGETVFSMTWATITSSTSSSLPDISRISSWIMLTASRNARSATNFVFISTNKIAILLTCLYFVDALPGKLALRQAISFHPTCQLDMLPLLCCRLLRIYRTTRRNGSHNPILHNSLLQYQHARYTWGMRFTWIDVRRHSI